MPPTLAVERPTIPGYGIPETVEGTLPWSWAQERLSEAETYWIGTSRTEGRPHLMPIWAAWHDGRLWFEGGRSTRHARNLAVDPHVSIGIELPNDGAVIMEGLARIVAVPPDRARGLVAGFEKYRTSRGYQVDPANWTGDGAMWAVEPRTAFGWTTFPTDATRWRFGVSR